MAVRLGSAALLALAVGCGPEPEAPSASSWTSLGEHLFALEGGAWLGPELRIPGGGAGFALRVELEGCAQLARLSGAEPVVRSLESGPSCLDCGERHSLVAGEGLYVHAPAEARSTEAFFRLARMDCRTLAPTRSQAGGGSFRAWWRALPEVPSEAELRLRLRHGPFSVHAEDERALMDRVRALMAPAGLRLSTSSRSNPELPDRLRWFEGDPEELAAVVDTAGSTIEVLFAGCLEREHPETGRRDVLDGLVPRVPGLGARGGGVFLRGRACEPGAGVPVPWSLETEARRMAHELGHFLGLYHSVERGGEADKLPDTADDTLMVPNPTLVELPVFSPMQATRMRLHARLLAEGLQP